MARRQKKSEPRYTFLAITIDGHRAVTSAGINPDLLGSGPRYLNDEAPVFRYDTTLELNKVRGESRYSMVIWVAPQAITDALVLLSICETLYASIHESAFQRKRQIRRFTIQTTDPAEE